MKSKLLPVIVLVVAVAALGGTISYAVARATDGSGLYGSMMSGAGYTMMGSGGQRTAWYVNGSGPIDTIPAARAQAQRFADRLGLTAGEVLRFSDNFYVRLDDAKGQPATEVLVDRENGAVTLEYGPAMMWNTRYGMMGRSGTGQGGGMMGASGGMMGGSGGGMMSGSTAGMMGGGSAGRMMSDMMGRYGSTPTWTPGNVTGPLSASEARRVAGTWLSRQGTGQAAGDADAFPGYYTIETMKNGKIAGMLSVNKATGAVWYHWWHGRFLEAAE